MVGVLVGHSIQYLWLTNNRKRNNQVNLSPATQKHTTQHSYSVVRGWLTKVSPSNLNR